MNQMLLRNLKLRQFAYLIAIAELGSIRKAAQKHNLSQPALSKLIREVEIELGAKLFVRSGNTTVATEYGSLLVAEARQILYSAEFLQTGIERIRSHSGNLFHIGATPNAAARLIPEAFMRLKRTNPNLIMQLTEGHSEDLLQGIVEKKYDLVIARAVPFHGDIRLNYKILYPETGFIVGRADHPLAREKSIQPDDLKSFPWIFPRAGPTVLAIELGFLNAGITPPQPTFICYTVSIILEMMENMDALTIFSSAVANPFVRRQQISLIPVALSFPLPSYAIYRHRQGSPNDLTDRIEAELLSVAEDKDLGDF